MDGVKSTATRIGQSVNRWRRAGRTDASRAFEAHKEPAAPHHLKWAQPINRIIVSSPHDNALLNSRISV